MMTRQCRWIPLRPPNGRAETPGAYGAKCPAAAAGAVSRPWRRGALITSGRISRAWIIPTSPPCWMRARARTGALFRHGIGSRRTAHGLVRVLGVIPAHRDHGLSSADSGPRFDSSTPPARCPSNSNLEFSSKCCPSTDGCRSESSSRSWSRSEPILEMHELVQKVGELCATDAHHFPVFLLLVESATNILGGFNSINSQPETA